MTLQPTLKKLYPEGSIGGQCAVFAEKLITIPNVGDTLILKRQAVQNNGIPIGLLNQAFRLGDVLILDVGTKDGHVAVINTIDFLKGLLTLTESNYHLDKKVHHTRQISLSDQGIVGILRGIPKFAFPAVNYPLQLKVALIFNNQTIWNSVLNRMAEIQDWFWKNSGQKIELMIHNPFFTSQFTDIPTKAQGSGLGAITQVIDEQFYEQDIMSVAPGFDIYIFVMRPEDFKGQVYNQNGVLEVGYSYEPHFPIKTFVVMDENTDYPPDYSDPDLQGLSKFVCHEISHGLYGVCLDQKNPHVLPNGNTIHGYGNGTDLTHQHFYGLNGYPQNPVDIFGDFDLSVLAQKIN